MTMLKRLNSQKKYYSDLLKKKYSNRPDSDLTSYEKKYKEKYIKRLEFIEEFKKDVMTWDKNPPNPPLSSEEEASLQRFMRLYPRHYLKSDREQHGVFVNSDDEDKIFDEYIHAHHI